MASQAVPLFEPHTRPRLRRYLLLCASGSPLPAKLSIRGGPLQSQTRERFSQVEIVTLKENLTKGEYIYRECEARLTLADRTIALRMGLLPSNQKSEIRNQEFSWWQWCRSKRLWSGPLAEARPVGGHLVPYTTDTPGRWENQGLQTLGEQIARHCGDALHGDLFLIVWKSGCVQITAHFKADYFHYWPKPIPAFPVIWCSGASQKRRKSCDQERIALHRSATAPALIHELDGGTLIQPWTDLRVLANKTKHNQFIYLDPGTPDVMPAGVSRSFWFTIGGEVARYRVPPSWYRECGVIETDQAGPAAEMAGRSAALIREHTEKDGFDAGRVWRYLRRDLRTNIPQEDGAEWEGNLAQAMFTLAYQRGEDPAAHWDLDLHHAYHAADIVVYHGSWMERLECSATFSAPLPKFRFSGLIAGYLETGDPYLLEVARSLAGVYMAMEWAHQPRAAIGRDAYPMTSVLMLWDYTAEPLYLEFARQTARRLLATQHDDGGFFGQAGAGVLSGTSCLPVNESISFGSGCLAPLALLEWAVRDNRWTEEFIPNLRRWADLMLQLQPTDGIWLNGGSKGTPYTLIGSCALFSLVKAGQLLGDPRCRKAIVRYLATMNANQDCVAGTHAFLSALYAHVADSAWVGSSGYATSPQFHSVIFFDADSVRYGYFRFLHVPNPRSCAADGRGRLPPSPRGVPGWQHKKGGGMTSRERVARALERRDHDRVPRFDQIWPETLARWRGEGMLAEPSELFDWDMVRVGWISPAPFPGRREVVEETTETEVIVGEWGQKCRVWKNRSGTPEHLGWECADPYTWRKVFRPRLSAERWVGDWKSYRQNWESGQRSGKWTCLCGVQSYEAMKAMLGDEVMLMAFAAEPEWVREMSSHYTNVLIGVYERIFQEGIRPDALWIFEDLAYRNGPLCSPAMYRDLVWPDHKRLCDFAHGHGMKFIFHTDGDINGYMDLLVDAEFDCLQPLEAKAGVDIRQLAPRYGSRISFFGNVDMMVAITNDKVKVEEEIRCKLAAGMVHRGYLYHSDHSVPPQVSWETYRWLMECLDRYGRY